MSRDKVLQSAAELIAERGEAQVRLVDVADRSGLSIGAIQHHFRSRDRLVAEAQLERFVGPAQADVEAIDTMLSSAGSVAEVRDVLSLITRAVVDRSRTLQRMDRLSSLSAAHGRPDVYEAVQAQVSELSEQFAGAIRISGRDQGLCCRIERAERSTADRSGGHQLPDVIAERKADGTE
ncbi:MAG: TetR/AcrR family transcriptional regulator [Actinobacteria bacterium]|nr:TetR/AcrR family transcriptional regulator [Actinomycetota bacterium]